jgi:hypothetical protein
MGYAGTSHFAVVIAAVGGFIFGAIYYGLVSKPWIRAGRIDPALARPGPKVLAITFICELVMAFVLAGIIASMGPGHATLSGGLLTGFTVWAGFMVTTMAVNHRYQGYGWDLTLIDGGHWLGVALVMGAVIGWFGAPPT